MKGTRDTEHQNSHGKKAQNGRQKKNERKQ